MLSLPGFYSIELKWRYFLVDFFSDQYLGFLVCFLFFFKEEGGWGRRGSRWVQVYYPLVFSSPFQKTWKPKTCSLVCGNLFGSKTAWNDVKLFMILYFIPFSMNIPTSWWKDINMFVYRKLLLSTLCNLYLCTTF